MLLIANPASGSSDAGRLADAAEILSGREAVRRVEPSSIRNFDREVREAASGETTVIVAGGDGTFNRVVNALFHRHDEIDFGLIPMGTGNDLARTLNVPGDPIEAARDITTGARSSIDVSSVSGEGTVHLFVNACMGGFPVTVNEEIDDDVKKRLGPVAFLWGGVKALSKLQRWDVSIDGAQVPDCVAAGVGNGRTCGGGIEVWPDADPDDGLLDVYALPAGNAIETLQLGAKIRSGTHDELADVTFARARRVRIEASPEMDFNVDGELVGMRTPLTFEVVGKLRMLMRA